MVAVLVLPVTSMTIPKMHPVVSTCIAAVGYDGENWTAFIRFRTGSLYAYLRVPWQEFENLRTAESVGGYFNDHFRVYAYQQVE